MNLELAPLTLLCGPGALDIWHMFPWVFATLCQGRGVESWDMMCGTADEVEIYAVGGDFDIVQRVRREDYRAKLENLPDVYFQYGAHRELTVEGEYRDPRHKRVVGMISAANLAVDPQIQREIMERVTLAVSRGHQMIVERHSNIITLGVQLALCRQLLSPEDVIVHRITRSTEPGDYGDVQSLRMDQQGMYPTSHPFYMGDIYLEMARELLKLRLGGKGE